MADRVNLVETTLFDSRVNDCVVGVVGAGQIALPIALRLRDAGLELLVAETDFRRQALVLAANLRLTALEDLSRKAAIVHVAVFDERQVSSVVVGVDGILKHMPSGGIVVIHSSTSPQLCRDLARQAAEKGITLIDAPVTGGPEAAHAGTLTLLVGGDPANLDRLRTNFDAIARDVVRVGPVGSGQVAKLLNGFVVVMTREVTREVVAIGASAGLSEDRVIELMMRGSARSWVIENWSLLRDANNHGSPSVRPSMAEKEMALLGQFARDIGYDSTLLDPLLDVLTRRKM